MTSTAKRIVLIDDEVDIHRIAQVGLKMAAGWQLLSAQSSREGLELVAQEQPDAILLDVMMPECDGITTFRQLQAAPALKHIPVIFMTAKAQAADRRRLYSLGATGMITKPFDPMTLASQIAGFAGWVLPPGL